MGAMTRHRSDSAAFKRQVAQEFIAGETLHALSKRHEISRQLIRIWKFEAGALDDDVRAADLIQEYKAKIAALERMFGRQALEMELLKGALKHVPRPRSASTSIVTGPATSRSAEVGMMHIVCYLRQGSKVFETYWTTRRGVEAMDNSYRLLDLTVYGRQEMWEDSPTGWPQRFRGKQTFRTDGRPTAQWSRLKSGYSDDLGTS
jgi:predicted dithiol-disulfide oxidoreductase (DUF899 family)